MSLSTGVVIRAARPADAEGIARVQTLSWRAAYAGLLPDDFLARHEATEELWRQRMADLDPRTTVLVAERDDHVIGFATAGTPPPSEELEPSTGLFYAIYLLAETWGTGVGYRLHEAAVAAMATAGFGSAVLWVLGSNQRAIDFYARQGWIDDSHTREETIDGQAMDVARYRLHRLAPQG